MKIDRISIQGSASVHCRSCFYSARDCLLEFSCYTFIRGVNTLVGEIDSGAWAASYLLSMYEYRPKDFILLEPVKATLHGESVSFRELTSLSCYMDRVYPLFSDESTVREMITQGLEHSALDYSCQDIKELFCLDDQRFERPLRSVGNEIFRAMAAIGLSYGKEIFCFPWLSRQRFDGYHRNMTGLFEILESLGKITISPVGYDVQGSSSGLHPSERHG